MKIYIPAKAGMHLEEQEDLWTSFHHHITIWSLQIRACSAMPESAYALLLYLREGGSFHQVTNLSKLCGWLQIAETLADPKPAKSQGESNPWFQWILEQTLKYFTSKQS